MRDGYNTMDRKQYIPTEVENLIEGGTLLKNLLQDCKEKYTESAIYNIQYSKGNCTFELVENKLIICDDDDGSNCYGSNIIAECAFFGIECIGVTQIEQEGTNLDYGYHADINFSTKKLPDKTLISFSYVNEWTQTNLFFVEAEKMRLVKYKMFSNLLNEKL